MADEQLIRLIEKYLAGKASQEERLLVENWFEEQGDDSKVFHQDDPEQIRLAAERSLAAIRRKLQKEEAVLVTLRPRRFYKYIAAASVLIMVSVGGYFLLKPKQQQQIAQRQTHDIAPGHNQATLTLANGKKIVLTKGLSGLLALQGKTSINATGNDITYTPSQQGDQLNYNTMSTARGEQSPYPLVLADGTKVWLNAESSITFPTAFNGNNRTVSVSGEVYFEVRHDDRKPFIVKAGSQTIQDIGTQFDVKAYNDEPAATTLVEGSVKVNSFLLKPGEQLKNDKVQPVNAARYTAWKNGDFDFEGDNIQSVMRQLSRWYNIDVAYQGTLGNIGFYAKISRAQNISVVLNALQRTQGVKFQIDGRRVIVVQ